MMLATSFCKVRRSIRFCRRNLYFSLCLFLHFHEPCNKILKHVTSLVKDVHDMLQRNVALNVASLVKDLHDMLQKNVASPVKDVHDMPQRNVALNVASLVKDVHDTLQKNVALLMKDVRDMIYKKAVSLEMGCNDKFCMNEIFHTQDLIYTCSSYSY